MHAQDSIPTRGGGGGGGGSVVLTVQYMYTSNETKNGTEIWLATNQNPVYCSIQCVDMAETRGTTGTG